MSASTQPDMPSKAEAMRADSIVSQSSLESPFAPNPKTNELSMTSNRSNSIHSFSQIEGIDPPQRLLERTRLGPRKKWSRLQVNEKAFVIICYVGLIASLAMTIYKLAATSMSSADSTYALILLTATLFSFFYVTKGVFQERGPDLVALCITNGIVLCYVIINFVNHYERHAEVNTTKLVRLVFTAAFSIVVIPLAVRLALRYQSRQTFITFTIGSVNDEIRSMASSLFQFLSAITFDIQMQLNLLILVMRQGLGDTTTTQLVILGVGLFITILWGVIGCLAVTWENAWLLCVFVLLSLPNVAYACYMFYSLSHVDAATQMFKLIITAGAAALVMRVCILSLLPRLYRNFGKGLKEAIYRGDKVDSGHQQKASDPTQKMSSHGDLEGGAMTSTARRTADWDDSL